MQLNPRPVLATVILLLYTLLISLLSLTSQAGAAPPATSTVTPTPASTEPLTTTITMPVTGPEGYRLRTVTEAEMLAMVKEAQQQLENYHDPDPYGYSEYTLYLYLIQKEALQGFPSLKDWDQRYQDLVYRANIEPQTDPFLYDDFIHLLEKKLNSHRPAPINDIEQELASYEIKLTRYNATNLFGNRQVSEVWQLNTGHNALLALRTTPQEAYQLIPVRAGWLDSYQGEETISVEDYNGNGLPEIASINTAWGHAGCYSDLTVYEWTESGKFVNLAEDTEHVWGSYIDHDCENVWRFGTPDSTGVRPIIQSIEYDIWADTTCHPYQVEITYQWTGQSYQPTRTDTVIPFDVTQPAHCAVGWAELAAEKGLYERAISLLESVLKDPSPKISEIWGPDGVDYLRFKLATWYAEQGRDQLARAELEQVQNQSQVSKPGLISQVAATYLKEYKANQDSDIACWAAIDTVYSVYPDDPAQLSSGLFDELIDTLKNLLGFVEPKWGYTDWSSLPYIPQDLCNTTLNPTDQVEFLLRKLRAIKPEDLIKALRTEGITVQELAQEQFGNNVSMLITTKVKGEKFSRLWLLQQSTGLTTARLFNLSLDYPQLQVTLEHLTLDKSSPWTYLLQINDQLQIFSLNPQTNEAKAYLNLDDVRRYQFDTMLQPATLTIQFVDKTTPLTYTWHSASSDFVVEADLTASQHQAAQTEQANHLLISLEDELFNFINPGQKVVLPASMLTVVELAQVDTHLTGGFPSSYLAYLIGLAYELTGDEIKAVQSYWQLWHDYPDSPYTLLVRRKLEPTEP